MKGECRGSVLLGNGCNKCPKCLKELADIKHNTTTQGSVSNDKPYYQMGWVCPKCGGVNSPSTSRCPCVPIKYKVTC